MFYNAKEDERLVENTIESNFNQIPSGEKLSLNEKEYKELVGEVKITVNKIFNSHYGTSHLLELEKSIKEEMCRYIDDFEIIPAVKSYAYLIVLIIIKRFKEMYLPNSKESIALRKITKEYQRK